MMHAINMSPSLCLTFSVGVRQSLLNEAGPLGELDQSDGLYRVRLLPPVDFGQWHLNVTSHGPITFNVLGKLRFLSQAALNIKQ